MHKLISIVSHPSEIISQLEMQTQSTSQFILITDQTVDTLFGSLFVSNFTHKIILPPGEKSKSLPIANHCWEQMLNFGADRSSCILALGGGVITDIAGFVGSNYMRGIDVIHIPTTLLGMVDAAIGGKTAINHCGRKNLIGSFHLPKHIYISPTFIDSLPKRDYIAGLAEVIKYGVIADADFFRFLENNTDAILSRSQETLSYIIQRCCEIKCHIVDQDPYDTKEIRAKLNWGHTIAHAIEALTGHQTFQHGEAVAIGMHCAAKISAFMSYVVDDLVLRQKELITRLELPSELPDIPMDQLFELIKNDKKGKGEKINLILAEKIGKVFTILDVDRECIRKAIGKNFLMDEKTKLC